MTPQELAKSGRAHANLSNTEKMLKEIGTEKSELSSISSEISSRFDIQFGDQKKLKKSFQKPGSNLIDFEQIRDQNLSQTEI